MTRGGWTNVLSPVEAIANFDVDAEIDLGNISIDCTQLPMWRWLGHRYVRQSQCEQALVLKEHL